MSVLQICALGVLTVTAVMLLKDAGAPHSEAVVMIFGIAVLGSVLTGLAQVVSFIMKLGDGTDVLEYVKLLLKASGVAFVCDVTSNLCNDAGQAGVARYVEIVGRCELLVLSLPLIKDLIDISFGMLNI